uniref:Peptidase_M13 domain-containing protein n=1 Tax=Panagrellus redivivus TaxID=6233 RepID=A0A7E4WDI2_PANRE
MDQLADRFVILLGILNDIFYNPDYIPVFNYGALGAVVGHEVIHGYDTIGIDFDGNGKIHPWMSNKSRESFDEMAKCIIDEYGNFTLTDSNGTVWHVNGTNTSGEDVADNGGIRAAYNAFKSDPVNEQPFPRTKKLKDFTQDQLFFMAYSRVWCSPPLADKDFERSFEDEHPPEQLRLFGALRNFVPFREAFNCPAGSKYAPEKYCKVYAPS